MMNKIIKFPFVILFLFVAIILIGCEEEKQKMEEDKVYDGKIIRLSKKEFKAGDLLFIYGSGFGNNRDNKIVDFDGVIVEEKNYKTWSDTLISVIVPEDVEAGNVYINSRISNEYSYEVDFGFFRNMIEIFVQVSIFISLIYVYLRINKIWKRKHDKAVAESISIMGMSFYLVNCILWVIYYGFITNDSKSLWDTSIYIFEGTIFFIIGTGIFVKGQRQSRLWALIKQALKIERSEADYLLKKFFKPKNADKIIEILHQLAMIDEHLDPKEQELIEAFAKEWNIDYSAEKFNKSRVKGTENNYIRLRNSVSDYLSYDPPHEQVGQLRDMMTALINVDDVVTNEEELINSELMGLISEFLEEKKQNLYHVLIVPQQPEHELIINETFPDAAKLEISGGIAYSIGSYYSYKYADMICRERRKINMFTIVHSTDLENLFYTPS